MRLLIIGDSYGLPRFNKNSMDISRAWGETYPEMLRKKLLREYCEDIVLINRCQYSNTSYSLVKGEADILMSLKPDYVVLQLGLSDLWPIKARNVSPIQQELKGKDPWITLSEYEEYMMLFCQFALGCRTKVILVNIADIQTSKYEVVASIESYNRVLRNLAIAMNDVFLVNMHNFTRNNQEFIGEDGIHLTADGSDLLATKIFNCIEAAQLEKDCILRKEAMKC